MTERRGERETLKLREAMLERLAGSSYEYDWLKLGRGDLLEGLLYEVAELTRELAYTFPDPGEVRKEAADVANHAMFIMAFSDKYFDEGWERME